MSEKMSTIENQNKKIMKQLLMMEKRPKQRVVRNYEEREKRGKLPRKRSRCGKS
jgi:hypothetical protein